jgi:hypothetical protein
MPALEYYLQKTLLGFLKMLLHVTVKVLAEYHGLYHVTSLSPQVVRGPAPLSLALAKRGESDGKVTLAPWTETDFRDGEDSLALSLPSPSRSLAPPYSIACEKIYTIFSCLKIFILFTPRHHASSDLI